MAKTSILFFVLFSLFLFLVSCGSDCQQVEIEKAEWITRYEEYSADTLVSYTVSDATQLIEHSNDDIKDEHFHYVSVKNRNEQYSNMFAVKFEYYYGINSSDNWEYTAQYTAEYIEIQPNSEHNFEYKWYGVKAADYSNFYVNITVLQQPKRISLTRRIDELLLSTITVNTCEQSVQALKREYKTVKDLYYAKVDANNGQPRIQSVTETEKEMFAIEKKMRTDEKKVVPRNEKSIRVNPERRPKEIMKEEPEIERCKINGVICLNKLNQIEQNLKTSYTEKDIEYVIRICNMVINSDRATPEEKEKAKNLKEKAKKLEENKVEISESPKLNSSIY